MPGTKFTTSITLTGPFFKGNPGKTFAENGTRLMKQLSEVGEDDVVGQLRSGEASRAPLRGLSPSRVSGYVQGRVQSLHGKKWKATAVVSVSVAGLSRKEAIQVRAAASRLEGRSHALRRTAGRLKRQRPGIVAELLKGIA